jgi:hypothetical protein
MMARRLTMGTNFNMAGNIWTGDIVTLARML